MTLALLKAKLGISTTIRDTFLQAIIDGFITELRDTYKLQYDNTNMQHIMLVVDMCEWRYSHASAEGVPRRLQIRIRDLVVMNHVE